MDKKSVSLRQSFATMLLRKSQQIQRRVNTLKGRYLFRSAVRRVIEYINWFNDETLIQLAKEDEISGLTLQDRAILLTYPAMRTNPGKARIFSLIKKFKAFKKYPIDLRRALADKCLYQHLPPGRVIVRQGHKPVHFYFIVDGQVSLSRIATEKHSDESKEIDMGTMQAGDTFGEVAMYYGTPRTATVVSKTPVDLFLIQTTDFNDILREFLTEEWKELQDALVNFNYFKGWNEGTMRDCCILSKIKTYKLNEILLGDGKGMVNYVHFLLEGECRLIEHMMVRVEKSFGNTEYKLVPESESEIDSIQTDSQDSVTNENMEILKQRKDTGASRKGTQVNYSALTLLKAKQPDEDQMSIITTTLLDVLNKWHEITDVAAMLMREPSMRHYPKNVRTVFMQIGTFYRGACFGLGEEMCNRRIVATSNVKCFLIPRYWLFERNRANVWGRVKLFMDSRYPSREKLFAEFVRNRKWVRYKKDLLYNIIKKTRCNTAKLQDVPYSIRINDVDEFHEWE